jgi:hypothetical protein
VRGDDGVIYTRPQPAEHGDLLSIWAETADFTNEAPSGWITKEGVFIDVNNLQDILAPGERALGGNK